MNNFDKFKFGWVIRIVSKDDDFQIEDADLGNGKHMIVATDLKSISVGVFRQAGYGPFSIEGNATAIDSTVIETLKQNLMDQRIKAIKDLNE